MLTETVADSIRASWPNYVKRQQSPRRQGKVYPSSLVMGCKLLVYYDLVSAPYLPENRDASGQMIMDAGEFTHTQIQTGLKTYYESKGMLYTPEVRIKISPNCSGRCDAILFSGDYAEVHEYKTCSKGVFEAVTRNPKSEHEDQLQIYLKKLKIENGRVVYICRDNYAMREFPIKFNEKRANELYAILNEIEQAALTNTPPEASVTYFGATPCTKACAYRQICPEAKKVKRKL